MLLSVGLGPVSGPPPGARTDKLSTTTCWRFKRPSLRNSASKMVLNLFQTTERCHFKSQRRHGWPDGKASVAGKTRHGTPVVKTKTIQVKIRRGSEGFRPAYCLCRLFGCGINGSTSRHSLSDRLDSFILRPPYRLSFYYNVEVLSSVQAIIPPKLILQQVQKKNGA